LIYYKFYGDGKLTPETVNYVEGDKSKVKIRVTAVMPTESDRNIFDGTLRRSYPFIAGHVAIGVVSEDRDEYGLKRGTKVILNPYVQEVSDRIDIARTKIMGLDTEGFFRDFIYMNVENIIPFPEGVKEDQAIFADKIATALTALNSFQTNYGDYICIVGGTPVCNIIAQLALYFHLIPICVDTKEYRLELLRKCGVYYTINKQQESAPEKLYEYTGGKLCDHLIVRASSDTIGASLFSNVKIGGDCVIVCESGSLKKMDFDIAEVGKRQLKVRGVSNGAHEFTSAVNVLAQNILRLQGFIDKRVDVAEADKILTTKLTRINFYSSVINML